MGAFVIFGASSFIPLLHGVQRYGLEYMLQYSGMKWYLIELTFYGTGVCLYGVCLHAHHVFRALRANNSDDYPSAVPNSRAFVARYI